MSELTLEQATAVARQAQSAAEAASLAMNIAVVDAGGHLKAFVRMDDAWLGSIDIAVKKARTAIYFRMETGDLGDNSQPGGPLYNLEVSNGGLITFPGGVPLTYNGESVGAIGVSGSTVENDRMVALAGVDSLASVS